MKLVSITPTIAVTNLHEGVAFYEKIGFSKDWIWPQANPTHASVSKDSHRLMLSKSEDSTQIQKANLYFTIDEVRAYHDFIKHAGIDSGDLIQSAYGMLDFSFTDPWGHNLTFGQPEGDFES